MESTAVSTPLKTLFAAVQQQLTRRGVLFCRVYPEVPPSCATFLRTLAAHPEAPEVLFCFDNDVQIQAEILAVFRLEAVTFLAPFLVRSNAAALTPSPARRFAVMVDGDTYDPVQLVADAPWVAGAEMIVVRCSLGFFWSGRGDLTQFAAQAEQHGFALEDVLDHGRPGLLKAPSGRVVLIFRRKKTLPAVVSGLPNRSVRVAEALAYLSSPIAGAADLTLLAGRGSYGHAAGVFNPGAVREGDELLLVARGENTPWPAQLRDESRFLASSAPLLMRLKEDRSVCSTEPLQWVRGDAPGLARAEDFRLFRHEGRLFSNHSVVHLPSNPSNRKSARLRVEALWTRMGLSEVDLPHRQLRFIGFPAVDRPLAKNEKNWVMFSHAEQLHLLYSFQPYHLLRAGAWPKQSFETVTKRLLALPLEESAGPLRNSINPVEYDEDHLLHVVHQVHRGQNYVFWAVLIAKASLLPVKISRRPLARSWHSAAVNIIYLCSAVVEASAVLFFAGLNDSATGCWRVARADLDRSWVVLR